MSPNLIKVIYVEFCVETPTVVCEDEVTLNLTLCVLVSVTSKNDDVVISLYEVEIVPVLVKFLAKIEYELLSVVPYIW